MEILPKSYTCSTLSWPELNPVSCAIKINSHLISTDRDWKLLLWCINHITSRSPIPILSKKGFCALVIIISLIGFFDVHFKKNIHLVINDDGEKEDDYGRSSIHLLHMTLIPPICGNEWRNTRNLNDFISHKRTRGDNFSFDYCNLNLRGAYCAYLLPCSPQVLYLLDLLGCKLFTAILNLQNP